MIRGDRFYLNPKNLEVELDSAGHRVQDRVTAAALAAVLGRG